MPNKELVLKDLTILVIGAGPGGLTFAMGAQAEGAKVQVIERAGDPRSGDAGYTDRSFNLTLNNVGRAVLGTADVWEGGVNLQGRAIHPFGEETVKYANSGTGNDELLVSIPRPLLRQNMVSLAEKKGVKLLFNSNVTGLECDKAQVMVKARDGKTEVLEGDLIVIADGIHSVGDNIIENVMGGSLNMHQEQLNYINVMLNKEACKDLSLKHINFWQKPLSSSIAIGLPNGDGTIAALLISKFDDVEPDASPFETLDKAQSRLEKDFPQLLKLDPELASQVVGKKRGHFYYKSISTYVLSDKCVIVGDAGSACPPWAGFGANTAIYSADALVRFMVGLNGNLVLALEEYQKHKRLLAELVLNYAREHGEFLNRGVTQNPEQRPIGPVLGKLINEAISKSVLPAGVKLLSFN